MQVIVSGVCCLILICACLTTSLNNETFTKKNLDRGDLFICGTKDLDQGSTLFLTKSNETEREKRATNKHREQYLELMVVVDYKLYILMKRNQRAILKYCQDIVNIVNIAFSDFDILVILVDVIIWTSSNPITITDDTSVTLKNFKNFLYSSQKRHVHHDIAQLIIGTIFKDASGVGSVGGFCSYSAAGVVSYSGNLHTDAMVMVHELGHNFGLNHNTGGCCGHRTCIMNEVTSFSNANPHDWSDCSRQQMKKTLSDPNLSSCLYNYPDKVFGSGSCGNGILEEGEQCDCGLREACKVQHCCDPDTCTLKERAQCGHGACCNKETCQLHPEATICREAVEECDLEEYCDGVSYNCPKNVHKQDGNKCNQGVCSLGSCVGHSLECQKIWKSPASTLSCYQKNTKGNFHGNCGAKSYKQNYKRCTKSDVLCGRLQCDARHRGCSIDSVMAAGSHYTIGPHYARREECCVAEYKMRGWNTLGLVPEGAQCGKNKFCVAHQCVYRDDHVTCGAGCNGNGVCNDKGHCHCIHGLRPPDCIAPGTGGSIDSGPSNSYEYLVQTICYILFLVFVPVSTSFGGCVYYFIQKKNPAQRTKKFLSLCR